METSTEIASVNTEEEKLTQPVFSGTYKNRLDPKGRVSIPAEFRQSLCGEGQNDKAIYAFPSPRGGRLEALSPIHFQHICRDIENSTAMFSDEEDSIMAQIVAAARRIAFDGNGRILLPKEFLDEISLSSVAVFVGFARRFVIFSESSHQRWHKERSRKSIAPFNIPTSPN